MKLQAFYSSYFRGKSYFEDDGTQYYFVFQPVCRYFKMFANTSKVLALKSRGLSVESVNPLSTSDNILYSGISYTDNAKIRVKLDESCLKQEKVYKTHQQMLNIFNVYE